MAVRPGKPGSRRVWGRQRAQLGKVHECLSSLLAYNSKLQAKVPPVPFLTAPQVTLFEQAAVTAAQVEALVN